MIQIGDKFGRLEVISVAGYKSGHKRWLCRCVCGTERPVFSYSLNTGNTTSCGCFNRERSVEALTVHGHTSRRSGPTPEYRAWVAMIQRCYNEKNPRYGSYGGRGIVVSDEWRHSFQVFLADMGPRPSPQHSLDREDNDGDYCCDNCKWSLPVEQMNNRRMTQKMRDMYATRKPRQRRA